MRAIVSMACAVVLIGFASGAAAQGNGAPKTTVSTKATGSPKTPATTATGSTKTTTTAHGGTHSRTTEPKATGSTKTTGHARTTTPTTTTTTTTPTGTAIPLTPVQQKLQKNTNLAGKLQSRLPAGTDLNTAAAGFRNLGQFVAAVNVSNNLGLDFTTLKTAMVTDGKSLGQAIQSQKGTTVNATEQAHRAERDADTMIRSTEKTEKTGKKSTGHDRP